MHNIIGVMLMAGEWSYFSNKSVVWGQHVYKHIWMPGIDKELSVEKELHNLHDNFTISVVKNEPYAGNRSQRSTPPRQLFENWRLLLYRWPPALKRDPAAIRDNTVCVYIYIWFYSKKTLAYTRFVVMTQIWYEFYCLKETMYDFVKSKAKKMQFTNQSDKDGSSLIFAAKRV